jgi:hypothetical protein
MKRVCGAEGVVRGVVGGGTCVDQEFESRELRHGKGHAGRNTGGSQGQGAGRG